VKETGEKRVLELKSIQTAARRIDTAIKMSPLLHWQSSAGGDANAEHDIYDEDAVCDYP
jgi:hypothetical protein